MQKIHRFIGLLSCLCMLCGYATVTLAAENMVDRPEVQSFIQNMAKKHHFSERQLKTWLQNAQPQESILKAIAKPAEKLTWERYQPIFITPKRIDEGVIFWEKHKHTLAKAQKEFGVPAEIIIAIIGVETFYGKQAGQYRVLDALVTLGFDYPPRSSFFLSELEQFLLLAREEKWDPTQIKGSYAGAMGIAQFIASSYRHYAIDFNHNGERNIIDNVDDAIGSVGNYFKANGWQKDGLVTLPASVNGKKFESVLASSQNPKPNHSLEELAKMGIQIKKGAPFSSRQLGAQPFAFVALDGANGPEYWLGAHNFYVITRYNRSSLYAMAVYDLSQKIKVAYEHKATV